LKIQALAAPFLLGASLLAASAASATPPQPIDYILIDGTATGTFNNVAYTNASYQEIFSVVNADVSNPSGTAVNSVIAHTASGVGASNPIADVSLSINGSLIENFTPNVVFVALYNTPTGSSLLLSALNTSTNADAYVSLSDTTNAGFVSNLTKDFTVSIGPSSSVTNLGSTFSDPKDNTCLTLTPVSAYPEPDAWALMIMGVAVVGMMWRRAGVGLSQTPPSQGGLGARIT